MAIKNADGNYLKITRIDDSDLLWNNKTISWEIWADETIRTAPTSFDKPNGGSMALPDLAVELDANADETLSIKNNRITAAYKCLLETPKFSGWTSC